MQAQTAKKKAIVVVSFGTSYPETLKLNIESVENRIREAFPDYEVRRAFTSRTVISLLAKRDGVRTDNEVQALERLRTDGFQEVYIQPLHIVPGAEYDKIRRMVNQYAHAKDRAFEKIRLSRPLLYAMGQDNHPDDYEIAIKALASQLPEFEPASAVVLMGHGGMHPANAAYGVFQLKLEDAGLANTYIYTVEGYPSLDRIIGKLKQKQVKKVTLMPFLLVAGDHAAKDMAGEAEDSAKSQLLAAGFEVDVYFRGLGENKAFQDIYVAHLQAAIDHPPHGHII
ncbi:sirohydrochlorin cobaltochelatase [Sporomusa acidovorans]|uniref:Sirohydrochlorin cobaltochelatase n=1 Tax=Sporomusa acidovorans (strain ATCC 49682 / DSM 3132 / Mol) TaxID=1123286 RepID=A0ABZ3IYZ7_SPOA4|nr:sirohydrochlorin cobaltochelatase [Sporomusa acidovorans]OZC17647.1 sirohydrochlorin cobaltochelatase [Sporomusa acidovorans DSM 3132]SDE10768.1 anaerobic cobaltochelatase [Sporomusa acidovorans]